MIRLFSFVNFLLLTKEGDAFATRPGAPYAISQCFSPTLVSATKDEQGDSRVSYVNGDKNSLLSGLTEESAKEEESTNFGKVTKTLIYGDTEEVSSSRKPTKVSIDLSDVVSAPENAGMCAEPSGKAAGKVEEHDEVESNLIDGKIEETSTNGKLREVFENMKIPLPNVESTREKTRERREIVNGYSINGYTTMSNSNTYYHNSLGKEQVLQANQINEANEDGYAEMSRRKRSLKERLLRLPFKIAYNILYPNAKRAKEPGTLILIRHGESEWNANKTFTGWADPDLSEQGRREVQHAARLILESGYEIDAVFTSRLKRAVRSAWIILQELNEIYLPVFKSWRLNERMYGALTGLSKTETAERLGEELVQEWRGSLRSRPPALRTSDPYWPGRDRKYADLTTAQIPSTESLMDCMERTIPVWESKIMYELKRGRNVMVVAHANTLRGLVKTIDDIGDDEIQEVAIPTGIPIIYKFDKEMNIIPPSGDRQTASQVHMNGLFLEKPGVLKQALKREEEWSQNVPGYNYTISRAQVPMSTLERSLYKLKAERELGEWAGQFVDPNYMEDDGNDGNMGKPIQIVEDDVWRAGLQGLVGGEQFDPDAPVFHEVSNDIEDGMILSEEETYIDSPVANVLTSQPCITSMPSSAVIPGFGSVPIRRNSVIVIIRHGKTEHNKLGLFTGWEDAPLAQDGIAEAREAGKLLKAHGFEFDVVYTSWLSRAIDTAWYVMDELDSIWLPIIKSWRLNERMYGSLTGLSKRMVAQRHGESQFKAWRRGYKTKPPKVSSFSQHYPGNDRRYQKYMSDVRISIRESTIRTIESGKVGAHRKYPKAESLKDCMDRTIPFFTQRILPEAVYQGKRVLISSSENAIRGLLMHLCDIPEEKITDLEIPNGLPLVFDLQSKCLKLLDDGTGRDPLETYNFGKAAPYLFKPCEGEDGTPDEECDIHFNSEPVSLTADEQATIAAIKGEFKQ